MTDLNPLSDSGCGASVVSHQRVDGRLGSVLRVQVVPRRRDRFDLHLHSRRILLRDSVLLSSNQTSTDRIPVRPRPNSYARRHLVPTRPVAIRALGVRVLPSSTRPRRSLGEGALVAQLDRVRHHPRRRHHSEYYRVCSKGRRVVRCFSVLGRGPRSAARWQEPSDLHRRDPLRCGNLRCPRIFYR